MERELELIEQNLSSHRSRQNRTSYENKKYADRSTKNEKKNSTERELELIDRAFPFTDSQRTEPKTRTESGRLDWVRKNG
jgi:hypothetical protein